MKRWHLLLADVREGLRSLPASHFQCVVTSPPYWGLRRYPVADAVWGGDPGCQHRWGAVLARDGNASGPKGARAPRRGELEAMREVPMGAFCERCRAWLGQLGHEPTPDLYIEHLADVFDETHRVLRSDGLLWVNIGDTYATGGGATGRHPGGGRRGRAWAAHFADGERAGKPGHAAQLGPPVQPNRLALPGLAKGDLVGIPWLLVAALRARGWIWRSEVVWEKPNGMPESPAGWRWERHRVKVRPGLKARRGDHPGLTGYPNRDEWAGAEWRDCGGCKRCLPNDGFILRRGSWRPTRNHELVLLFSKSPRYFGDPEPVRQPLAPETIARAMRGRSDAHKWAAGGPGAHSLGYDLSSGANPNGANRRTVWRIAPGLCAFDHFATFPPELAEIATRSSTPEGGSCSSCAAPWAPVIEHGQSVANPKNGAHLHLTRVVGHRPTCRCAPATSVPARVLDPFVGSGTTGAVAVAHGRAFVGIDRAPSYLFGIARSVVTAASIECLQERPTRLAEISGPLFAEAASG